jgi:predicted CXXCH cytochrome family protein
MARPGRARWGLVGATLAAISVALAAGALGWSWWLPLEQAPEPRPAIPELPSPQLAYRGPFQNVHPDVHYVGDAVCARCHREIARTYKASGMGRSMRPIAEVAPAQRYGPDTNNPFDLQGYRFRVECQGDRMWHRQTRSGPDGEALLDFRLAVEYVIGSGVRGHSYISDRDGYLFQTAISWFSQRGVWDKSPGFVAERFSGRPVTEECLYCHANHAPTMEGFDDRYDHPFADGYAIGCERCHGPGQKHVRDGGTLADGFDPTIVNPARLEHGLREAVCQQCHLEGEARIVRRGRHLHEFRPGLPLDSVLSVFVVADEAGVKAVSHVEQMYHSECFRRGQGDRKMGCASCHDPHRAVPSGERVAFFRARCLNCHVDHGCSAAADLRAAKRDSCIDCHMPRFQPTDIVHTASTDHRVLRPGKTRPLVARDGGPIEPFLSRGGVTGDKELTRDLGMALIESASADTSLLEQGHALLEKLAADFPHDWAAFEMRGRALLTLGRPEQAMAVLGKILEKSPRQEMALLRYALACENAGHEKEALEAWRRAEKLNPWLPHVREHLCTLLIKFGIWQELGPHAEAWLRLDPSNVGAHKAWITTLVKSGRSAEARTALARARALHNFNQRELQVWFDDLRP